ncbi:hypothetical protein EJ03DRAFT_48616 [Teratosphaeria nubilosa]|uniref:Uncharacterized protein n=1 Tax=Teratosphaeria nubilosa TaxID=161662 RepID=A0A6G1KUG7_9PEZI|nr:hypothetical protein EJ03DRAFT_48616 [Teratosphaeria nubilosa]
MHLTMEDSINAFELSHRPLNRLEDIVVKALRHCVVASQHIRCYRGERAGLLALCLEFDLLDRLVGHQRPHHPGGRQAKFKGLQLSRARRARAIFASELRRQTRRRQKAWRTGTHPQQLAEAAIDAYYQHTAPRADKMFLLSNAERHKEPREAIKMYEKAQRHYKKEFPHLWAKGSTTEPSQELLKSFRNAKKALEKAMREYNMFRSSETLEYHFFHSILRETLANGKAHSVILSYKGDVLLRALNQARDDWLTARNELFMIGQGPITESDVFKGQSAVDMAGLDLEFEHIEGHLEDHMHGSASRWVLRQQVAAMGTEEVRRVVDGFLDGIPPDATSEVSEIVPEMDSWGRKVDSVKLGESCAGGLRTPSKYISKMLKRHQEACEKLRKEVERVRREG